MRNYFKVLLKIVTSVHGNEWKVYKETKGKYNHLLITRKKDGLVLPWEYYGPYTSIDNPIQQNIKAIESGINLKEYYDLD